MDLMQIYNTLSATICEALAKNGEQVICQPEIKDMRSIKKESLKLVTLWITNSKDNRMLKEEYAPILLKAILPDYLNSPPQVREPEVIECCKAILIKLESDGQDYIIEIFQAV